MNDKVPMGHEKVRGKKFFKESGKIKSKWQICMITQVKSKNDVCSQEMYGYGSLL